MYEYEIDKKRFYLVFIILGISLDIRVLGKIVRKCTLSIYLEYKEA